MLRLKQFLPGLSALVVGLAIWAGCETSSQPAPTVLVLPATSLKPGPDDPRIAHVSARLLEEFHYSQRPLDTELSKEFFDNYIDSLDPRHENFLQPDLEEFSFFRTNLDKLTINRGQADVTPAFIIYNRYAERIQQHNAYVNELLKQDKFKLNVPDEKIMIDRRKASFPTNIVEAEVLWKMVLMRTVRAGGLKVTVSGAEVGAVLAESQKSVKSSRDNPW